MASTEASLAPPSKKQKIFSGQWIIPFSNCEEFHFESSRYKLGGLHPVYMGDVLKNGRYKIIRKLGYGSFSTVWLAVDEDLSAFVAMKIMDAESSTSAHLTTELDICEKLSSLAKDDPLSQYVLLPLDTFEHIGPNGIHRCIVLPLMGAAIHQQVGRLPEAHPERKDCKLKRYPVWMVKRMLKHLLYGLTFLHKAGIVHADIHSGNTLFGLTSLANVTEASLKQDEERTERTRLNRMKIGGGSPPYLWDQQPLYDLADTSVNFVVKIADLGSAFEYTSPPAKTITPPQYRAPEIILGGPLGSAVDIWSFGCLLAELIIGLPPFRTIFMLVGCEDENDEEYLSMLYQVVGPFPDDLMSRWPHGQTFLKTLKGQVAVNNSDDGKEGMSPNKRLDEKVADEKAADEDKKVEDKKVEDEDQESEDEEDEDYPTLETGFAEERPNYISEEEMAAIITLLRKILQPNPRDRPSAEDLLKDPWFTSES